jgi:hypothetical protein
MGGASDVMMGHGGMWVWTGEGVGRAGTPALPLRRAAAARLSDARRRPRARRLGRTDHGSRNQLSVTKCVAMKASGKRHQASHLRAVRARAAAMAASESDAAAHLHPGAAAVRMHPSPSTAHDRVFKQARARGPPPGA